MTTKPTGAVGMKLLSTVVVINGRDSERNFGCSQVIRCPESKRARCVWNCSRLWKGRKASPIPPICRFLGSRDDATHRPQSARRDSSQPRRPGFDRRLEGEHAFGLEPSLEHLVAAGRVKF